MQHMCSYPTNSGCMGVQIPKIGIVILLPKYSKELLRINIKSSRVLSYLLHSVEDNLGLYKSAGLPVFTKMLTLIIVGFTMRRIVFTCHSVIHRASEEQGCLGTREILSLGLKQ